MQLHHHLLGNNQRRHNDGSVQRIEGDTWWWRLAASKSMDYDEQFLSASNSRDAGMQSRRASTLKWQYQEWNWWHYNDLAHSQLQSALQQLTPIIQVEAAEHRISLNLMYLIKLQELPVLKNCSLALQTCFNNEQGKSRYNYKPK